MSVFQTNVCIHTNISQPFEYSSQSQTEDMQLLYIGNLNARVQRLIRSDPTGQLNL